MKKILCAVVLLALVGYAFAGSFFDPLTGKIIQLPADLTIDDDLTVSGDLTVTGSATIGTTSVNPARMTATLSMTNGDTQTAITAAQILANYYISAQGGTVETDVQLPALTYPVSVCFLDTEAFVLEVCPAADGILDLDGTALDANDCIDSPGTVGSKMVCTNTQLADATWRWSCDTVRGAWVDTGATD